jgi:hypothetical protein
MALNSVEVVAELNRRGWISDENLTRYRDCGMGWMQAEFLAQVALHIANEYRKTTTDAEQNSQRISETSTT